MRKLLHGIVTGLFLFTLGFSVIPKAYATISSTNNKNVYNGDGTTIAWTYTFPIILSSDINIYTVSSTGVVTPIVSNFSINTSTAVVTYPVTGTPLPVGSQIVIYRSVPLTQSSSLKNQYRLPLDVIETALDKQTMMSQQLQEQISRSILSPINTSSSSGTGLSFPPGSANAVIGWDSTGSSLTNYNFQGLLPSSSPTFAGLILTGNSLTIGNLGGILKAAGGVVGTAAADGDYSTPTGTETFTNKTYDTNGTGNVFKIHGTTFTGSTVGSGANIVLGTAVSGNSGTIAQSSGSLTANHCAKFDASGNLVDNGSSCSGGSGMTYPASSGFAVSDTSQWLTSISTSGGISNANLNWTDIKSIGSGNVNWTDINRVATISGGVNWTGIQGIIKSQNINWNDLNGIAKLNSGGVNWQDFKNNQLNITGINWQSLNGIIKASGNSVSSAVSSTDYAPATSGNSILYGNNLGGFSNASIGSGLSFSGGVLSNTGSVWVPTNIQVFTSSGTWTKPASVSSVYVKVIGKGGTGGNGATSGSSGGGGGGGGYAEGIIAVTGNVTVTIGSTNSFAGSTTISATAGSNGSNGAASTGNGGAGGAGGTGSNGTINLSGGTGQTGLKGAAPVLGSAGGNTPLGSGGPATNAIGGQTASSGGAYGGGGAGGGAISGDKDSGGAGDAGAVIVYY